VPEKWIFSGIGCFTVAFGSESDSEIRRNVFAKDIACTDITPQGCNCLVARLTHNDEFTNAIHCRLGYAARPERVAANGSNVHPGSCCGSLEQFSN